MFLRRLLVRVGLGATPVRKMVIEFPGIASRPIPQAM